MAAFDIFGDRHAGHRRCSSNAKGNAMSHDTYELKAEAREQVGKGSAREVRRNGKVPAVIYGDKQPPLAIALSYKDIFYKIHGGGFLTTVATIDVDGKKIQVLPKDYQLDPVKDFPMHVDFLRIGKDTEVNVDVPVHFINEEKSPGIKRGGVLNISSVKLPKGVKPVISDRDFTIATIAGSAAMKPETEEAEAAAPVAEAAAEEK
jgi:large subunit ribosomal protein L25